MVTKLKLKQCSAGSLERLTRNRDIICFGSGNNMTYVFGAMADLKLEERVKYIVDNDRSKWGQKRQIGNAVLQIRSPEELKKEDFRKSVILLMIVNYGGILKQIEREPGIRNADIILYPMYRYWYDKYIDRLYRKMPITDTILMQGEGDTCENATALASYMRSHNKYKDKKIIWLCDHPENFGTTGVDDYILRDLPIKKHSFKEAVKYYRSINRSYLYLYENKMLVKARREQVSCYMNHGIPLKSTKGKITVLPDTDYVLSASPNINHIFIEQYGARKDQLAICGSPRTDTLYRSEISARLRDYLRLQDYHKMILWAPTFRTIKGKSRSDSSMKFRFGVPLIDSEQALERLIGFLAEEKTLLVIKPHIYQDMSELTMKDTGNIRVVRQEVLDGLHVNVYDLMKLSDSMITDYSSIAFDYLILDRPIGYTIDDMEQYTIGFSVDDPLSYMPGMYMRNMDDFHEYLKQVCGGDDPYRNRRQELRKHMFQYDDGKSCERLLNILGV